MMGRLNGMLRLVAFGLALCGAMAPAGAENVASDWAVGHKSQVRLIAGALPGAAGAEVYAAIEIAMEPKWKTYWRHPGDAGGIPPEFDFSASRNLGDVEVLFPVPERIIDESGTTYGYGGQAVFPVRLKPRDPTKPIDLRLNAFFGVCKDICIPAEADVALTIAAERLTVFPAKLAQALDGVPERVTAAQLAGGSAGVRLVSIRREGGAKPALVVALEGAPVRDTLVEGIDGVMVGVSERTSAAGAGETVYRVPLAHDDGAEAAGKLIRLTVALQGSAIEAEVRIP